jgi:hypothetical protein
LSATEETLSILQSLNGQTSISDLQEQLSDMKLYWRQQQVGSKNSKQQKALTELMQSIIAVLVTATKDISTDGDAADASEDDDDDEFYLLLSDQEMDQFIDQIEAISNARIDADACRRTIIQHGRGIPAMMELARQVLMYKDDDDPPTTGGFFYLMTASDDGKNNKTIRR